MARNKQIIGAQGLYYVAYFLSCIGYNVLTTSRNAKGADILVYNEECTRSVTVQVKTMTVRSDINVGRTASNSESSRPNLISDIWVFVDFSKNVNENPTCYIYKKTELEKSHIAPDNNPGKKTNTYSWWISHKTILNESNQGKDAWSKFDDELRQA